MNILVFDDHLEELKEIAFGLESAFDGTNVAKACDAQEMKTLISTWHIEDIRLHVAVLDIWVETTNKYELEFPYLIRETFPDSLIVHYTAHKEAKPVIEHARVKFGAHDDIISKGKDEGSEALHEYIRQYWEQELLKRASRVFGDIEIRKRTIDFRQSPVFHNIPCDTIEANTLLAEISHFHDDFSPRGFQQIKKYVSFTKEGNSWYAEQKL